MTAPSVWMIRLSLGYLFVSGVFGSAILIHKAVDLHPMVWALLPLHYETAIWGWVVQFVMGTAYWMFPRHLTGAPRGSEPLIRVVVVLYNLGLLTLLASALPGASDLLAVAGRGAMVVAIGLFAGLMRKRVVSYRGLDHAE